MPAKSDTSGGGASQAPASAFGPLRHKLFAVLWAATVLGNVGSFMRDVASGWLATEISTSPSSVALIQAAATLPAFLLAIPAGALADIVDRRKFLVVVQVFLASVSGTLVFLSATGNITMSALVALTFLGGAGAALIGPAWQSIVPELVPRSELKGAVALGSLGINIARSIGPAGGGLLLAAAGAAVTYAADVVSYVFVVAALLWWRRPDTARNHLTEKFGGAVRAGWRFTMASAPLRRVLLRTIIFFLFANVAWALLPLVARQVLGGGASFYGTLLGATGVGAVAGAVLLPRVRAVLGIDQLILAASLLMAAILGALSLAPPQWAGLVLALLFGASWITVLTSFGATVQGILPNWVRGRGLAVYLMAFNGAVTVSSLAWGAVADTIGVRQSLLAGAITLASVALFIYRYKLPETEADLSPSQHWPAPELAHAVEDDRGPVLVTVEYEISAHDRSAFLLEIKKLSMERRRDGAYAWGVSEDASSPQKILEWFFVESWAEHLRRGRGS